MIRRRVPAAEPWLRSSDVALCDRYDLAIVDLDGTVYVGAEPVAGAAEALAEARSRGMTPVFVTNNASREPDRIAEQLVGLGVAADSSHVLTSAQAAARLLLDTVPPGSRVLVVGGAGLRAALEAEGLVPVATVAEAPSAVVQGWAPELDWAVLAEGAYALERGLPWVATNTDRTLPTPSGRAPGNGAFVAMLEDVTGRRPDAVAGKPGSALLEQCIARFGSRRPLVVGDRLDTDIEAATASGLDSLLVLTGVTGALDLLSAPPTSRPTYLSRDLAGLVSAQHGMVRDASTFRVGGCSVTVAARHGDRVVLHEVVVPGDGTDDRPGEWLDRVRATAAAAWATSDEGERWELAPELHDRLGSAPGTPSAEEGP